MKYNLVFQVIWINLVILGDMILRLFMRIFVWILNEIVWQVHESSKSRVKCLGMLISRNLTWVMLMWVDFRITYFMGHSFVYEFWDYQLWWETQRRFPLDMNLTKWLSKCEGALLKGKEKTQVWWLWWWRCGNERHENKHKMMKKDKHKWIKVWKNGARKRKEKQKGEEIKRCLWNNESHHLEGEETPR